MSKLISTLKKKSIPYPLKDNWTWYKWGDLIESYQQGLIRSNSELNSDIGVDYFKMNFIDEKGDYTFNNLPKTSATKEEIEKFKIQSKDFFINVRNSKELVGKSCVVYGVDRDILFNHMLVRIKHKDGIPGSYVSAYLNTDFGKKLLDTCKRGTTTVVALYQKDIYELPFPIPCENLLRNIDGFFNKVNLKIELNNRINQELEAMAKLIYEYWFLQFDFPFDFAQDKPNVTSSGVEKPYKSSGGKMVWNKELKREIPEGWKSGYLSDLGKIIGGSTPSRDNPDFFSTCGIPWITPKDLSNNVGNKFIFKGELDISEKGKESASLNIMPRGTILMSSRAPIGYLAISVSDVTTNQGFKSFTPEEPFTTEFIYYKLNEMMPVIENNASGSTFKEISASTLRGIKIVMPSSKVIDAYTLKVAPLFEKQENIQKQNQELGTLRDWLLPMLMNGQVTVVDAEEMVDEKLGMVADGEREKYRVK